MHAERYVKIPKYDEEFVPVELIEIILTFASDSPHAILNNSLVCKSWSTASISSWPIVFRYKWKLHPAEDAKTNYKERLFSHKLWQSTECRTTTIMGPNTGRPKFTQLSINEDGSMIAGICENDTGLYVFHVSNGYHHVYKNVADCFPESSTNRTLGAKIISNRLIIAFTEENRTFMHSLCLLGIEKNFWKSKHRGVSDKLTIDSDGELVSLRIGSNVIKVHDWATGSRKFGKTISNMRSVHLHDGLLDVICGYTFKQYNSKGTSVLRVQLKPDSHKCIKTFQNEQYAGMVSVKQEDQQSFHVTIYDKKTKHQHTLGVTKLANIRYENVIWNDHILVLCQAQIVHIFDTSGKRCKRINTIDRIIQVFHVSRSGIVGQSDLFHKVVFDPFDQEHKQVSINNIGTGRWRVRENNIYFFGDRHSIVISSIGEPKFKVGDVVWNHADPCLVTDIQKHSIALQSFKSDETCLADPRKVELWGTRVQQFAKVEKSLYSIGAAGALSEQTLLVQRVAKYVYEHMLSSAVTQFESTRRIQKCINRKK
jgi:hypothetical protein